AACGARAEAPPPGYAAEAGAANAGVPNPKKGLSRRALIPAAIALGAVAVVAILLFARSGGGGSQFLTPIEAPSAGSTPIEAPAPGATVINTAQELYDVRNNLSGSYVLGADIDLSDFSGGEWTPIGDEDNPFAGILDGQGQVIRNLRITGDKYEYNGLFGFIDDGQIQNVGMENTHIDATYDSYSSYAGGIAGSVYKSSIENCYNTGAVTSSSYAGGIAGDVYIGNTEFCYYLDNIAAAAGNDSVTLNNVRSLSAAQMREQSSYAGFDFTEVWGMSAGKNDGLPFLRAPEGK
ncbi:MAG: hypothetical protein LBQ16_03390, partial [Gracilibacteraceae bacterium]|nr:hypothetical protein [Gracilibacteraceae bacterium]